MIDLSNYIVKHLMPYDVDGYGIDNLVVTNRTPAFYEVEFLWVWGSERAILRFNGSLDGKITKFISCFVKEIDSGYSQSVGLEEQRLLCLVFRGLNLRLWFPEFNFRRYVYSYTGGELRESALRKLV